MPLCSDTHTASDVPLRAIQIRRKLLHICPRDGRRSKLTNGALDYGEQNRALTETGEILWRFASYFD
ncbi:hypothetical protein VNO77_03722 [Canavalia gladiata]|uniref:Uncharacterized protein n=1 Tax=Canavalia gladiata TaxID=3824 RepID=A0AAN9MW23_CANGL